MAEEFFNEQLEGSKIKSQIVHSYFWKWAKVMVPLASTHDQKLGYLDFFSGPGKYEDGSDSTPLLILKTAICDEKISKMLVSVFNDKEKDNIEKLKNEIGQLDGIQDLKNKPTYLNTIVGDDIVNSLKAIKLVPSLVFIDPFGYKGLSLELIGSAIKDFGCDCIFFFNYNRINAAITNPFMTDHINSLFGNETADDLRSKVKNLSADEREILITKTFMESLKTVKGEYSVRFKFFQEDGSKTSHFLFFVSKHPLALKLMKQSMADHCEWYGGIPSYEFNPVRAKRHQAELFRDDNYGIKELAEKIYKIYNGQIKTRREIFEEHNIGQPYVENNYKDALLFLENEKKVVMETEITKRRKYLGKPTLGENIKIKF